jgi:hypothetical protein
LRCRVQGGRTPIPMKTTPQNNTGADWASSELKVLTVDQVLRIDDLLAAVGEYGEVHLVVQRGQLRYINQLTSHKAWDEGPPPKK